MALPITTASTPTTNTVISSDQTSYNDETESLGGTTTASIMTTPLNTPSLPTELTSELESVASSTGALDQADTVSDGSPTSSGDSPAGTSAVNTRVPADTEKPSTATLTGTHEPEPKHSSDPTSPSDKASATSESPDEGTTKELQPSSYQTSDGEAFPTDTQKQTPTHTGASNVVVTGSGDAIATFTPTKDAQFTSLTEATTTTDDNGIVVVIWPGGWKWKPIGDKTPKTLPNAHKTNPSPVADPGDDDSNDDDVSTKDAKSTASSRSTVTTTAPASTEASTTATSSVPTSETTTECTITDIPQCTKTISYITISQSVTVENTSTEVGECPQIPSCATGEQTTVTTSLEPKAHWVGYPADPHDGPSEAELDSPVDGETQDYLEDFFKEHDLLLDYEPVAVSSQVSISHVSLSPGHRSAPMS
ncbi:hypothetical protein IL306_007486 [Fusarium sp. DS 682]|nr:hypothetical protein IL306_007486 [Fusarium sp. DS 682]